MNPDLQSRLYTAKEFIDDCFNEALRLEQIAEQACLSEFHFQRLFRHTFRLTPHQYLTGRRLARAKELLIYTDLSVSEICWLVGFQSLGSFSTLFSRYTGLSPINYRARFGKRTHFSILQPDFSAKIPSCFLLMFGHRQ